MMRLMMPNPVKLNGAFYLRVHVPADIAEKARGSTISLPIGDEFATITVGNAAKACLRTKDLSVARMRFHAALAAVEKHWENLRKGPGKLSHKDALAAFDQDTPSASKEHWAKLIDAFEPRHPKRAELMRRAEDDVLACKSFPREHRAKVHSTNPLERLNTEIRRPTNVVGTFPNEAAVTRLVGAPMSEQNDEWAITRRHMTLKTVTAICTTAPMDPATIAAL